MLRDQKGKKNAKNNAAKNDITLLLFRKARFIERSGALQKQGRVTKERDNKPARNNRNSEAGLKGKFGQCAPWAEEYGELNGS